jgi:hypothetical protein
VSAEDVLGAIAQSLQDENQAESVTPLGEGEMIIRPPFGGGNDGGNVLGGLSELRVTVDPTDAGVTVLLLRRLPAPFYLAAPILAAGAVRLLRLDPLWYAGAPLIVVASLWLGDLSNRASLRARVRRVVTRAGG